MTSPDREAWVRALCSAVTPEQAHEALRETLCFLRVVRGVCEMHGCLNESTTLGNPDRTEAFDAARSVVYYAAVGMQSRTDADLTAALVCCFYGRTLFELGEQVGSLPYEVEGSAARRAIAACLRVYRSLRAS